MVSTNVGVLERMTAFIMPASCRGRRFYSMLIRQQTTREHTTRLEHTANGCQIKIYTLSVRQPQTLGPVNDEMKRCAPHRYGRSSVVPMHFAFAFIKTALNDKQPLIPSLLSTILAGYLNNHAGVTVWRQSRLLAAAKGSGGNDHGYGWGIYRAMAPMRNVPVRLDHADDDDDDKINNA